MVVFPVPTAGGGRKPEPELDRLSNTIKEFNDLWGNYNWQDADRVHRLSTEDIPERIARDQAYQNARLNSDEQNARIEHNTALDRIMTGVIQDDIDLYKRYTDDEVFRRWLRDRIFELTYQQPHAS